VSVDDALDAQQLLLRPMPSCIWLSLIAVVVVVSSTRIISTQENPLKALTVVRLSGFAPVIKDLPKCCA